MNNAVFVKTMENVWKHRDIKLQTRERRGNYLVPEPNCCTSKFFTEHLLALEMRKTQILMSKPVYLGLSKLDLSKSNLWTWYDYVKPKYGKKVKVSYMNACWNKVWNFKL